MNILGKTELKVSTLGFGGLLLNNFSPGQASKAVEFAIENNINYFDVAPTYGDSQDKLATALKPFRKDVFLACKSTERTAGGIEKELNNSLEVLQAGHFDVYQLHALNDVEKDVKAVFAKGGAMETLIKAKRDGRIRNIGFSAHTAAAALAAMETFDFDTIMFPVNFVTHFTSGMEIEVLAQARKRNMGIIGLKAMAMQKWTEQAARRKQFKCWYEPIDDPQLAALALGWSLNQGIHIAISPSDESLLRLMVKILPQAAAPNKTELATLENIAQKCMPVFP